METIVKNNNFKQYTYQMTLLFQVHAVTCWTSDVSVSSAGGQPTPAVLHNSLSPDSTRFKPIIGLMTLFKIDITALV